MTVKNERGGEGEGERMGKEKFNNIQLFKNLSNFSSLTFLPNLV